MNNYDIINSAIDFLMMTSIIMIFSWYTLYIISRIIHRAPLRGVKKYLGWAGVFLLIALLCFGPDDQDDVPNNAATTQSTFSNNDDIKIVMAGIILYTIVLVSVCCYIYLKQKNKQGSSKNLSMSNEAEPIHYGDLLITAIKNDVEHNSCLIVAHPTNGDKKQSLLIFSNQQLNEAPGSKIEIYGNVGGRFDFDNEEMIPVMIATTIKHKA